MANTLKIKRGSNATIPQGQLAEPLFTTDTYDLYIGKGASLGNQRFQKYIASGTSSQFLKGDGSLDSTTYQATSEKGQNNGYASLDSGGKVPVAQLPNSIMEYKGTWDASTNTPTLADGTGNAGDVYICSVGGTVNFGAGPITFAAGDWVVYSGSVWQKSINSNAVASVNGQTGAVVLYTDDISEDGSPTNLWFTNARARAALSATSPVQYNNSTGVISILDASATQSGVVTTGTQTFAGAKTFQVSGTYVDLARFYNDTNNKSLFVYADNSGTGLSNLTSFGGESIYFNRSGTEIQFAINGSLRARLITGGRFLLGSQFYTDDGVSLLQVNGQIRAGFTAATSAATRIVTVNSSDVMETRTPAEILSDIAALPLAGGTLTGALNGTSATFTGVVQGSAIKLTNMTAGSGALYYNTGESRLTLANYNASGIIRFETNGGTNAGTINANQTWTFPAQINGTSASFTSSVTTPAGFYIDANTYLYEGILRLTDLVGKKNILQLQASSSGHYITSTFLSGGSQQAIYISAKSTAGQNVIFNTDGTTTFSHGISGTSATFSKSSSSGSGNDFPRLQVENTLATQGDGTTTFNFADIRIASGNSSVQMFLATTYAAGTWAPAGIINVSTNHDLQIKTNNTTRLTISNTGAATFSSSVTASSIIASSAGEDGTNGSLIRVYSTNSNAGSRNWAIINTWANYGDLTFRVSNAKDGNPAISASGTSIMTLLSNAKVGIGTTSPGNKLAILDSDETTTPTLGTNAGKFGIFNGIGGGNYGIIMGVINNGNVYQQVQRIDGIAAAYNLLLQPSGGNVGIGTTSPLSILHILGQSGTTGLPSLLLYGESPSTGQRYGFNVSADQLDVSALGTNARIAFFTGGNASTAASQERMRITSGGNVGIGTTNPTGAAGLALVLNSGASQGRICIKTSSTGDASGDGLQIGMSGNDAFIEQRENADLTFATNATERMRITSGPSGGGGSTLCLGTTTSIWQTTNRTTLEINGNGSAILGFKVGDTERGYLFHGGTHMYLQNNYSGGALYAQSGGSGGVQLTAGSTAWAPQSDERLKNITGNIENAIDKLSTLRTVIYSWKSDNTNKENIGLIAQDVEKVLPQLIEKSVPYENPIKGITDRNEYLSLKYTDMIPVLVKAIQELKAELDILKNN